jgi:HK97 family phage prohead protease
MPKPETRFLRAEELRANTTAEGVKSLQGYAVRFNSPSVDLGGFTEICVPGLFTRTLKETPDILMLRDHAPSQLLARTTAGTLLLRQDEKGLAFEATLPNTAIAVDTFENVRAGNLTACSFGFRTRTDKWDNVDGKIVRTLLDVDLHEVSITSFAAYPATSVSLRSCPREFRSLLARDSFNGCDCDCSQCEDGDCEACSNSGCDDSSCIGCPNQDDFRSKLLTVSERHKLHMRLELSKRS